MSRPVLFLLLLIFEVLWGATIPLTKIAVSTSHHPFGLMFWQSLISVVVLYFMVLWRKSKMHFDRAHILFYAIVAFIGTLIPNTVSFISAFHLPGGVMALVIALVPMFALMVALTLKLERFQPFRLVGVLLGAVAIALIVLPESSLPDPTKAIFVLIALIAPLCYGIEGNYLSIRQPSDTGAIATLFGGSIVGTIVSLPVSLATGTVINPFATGIAAPEFALFGSTILHILVYVGYIWLVAKAGAVFSAQVAYIVTPAGILISMVVLGENPSPYIWLALVILLAGLFLVQPRTEEQ